MLRTALVVMEKWQTGRTSDLLWCIGYMNPDIMPISRFKAHFAKNGVIAHHWDFGDMPPVAGVSGAEVTQIIAYIRDLQREGGIIR